MTTRSLRVEFVPEATELELAAPPEIHDVTVDDDGAGAPQVLQNPHVDFPGTWNLLGEGDVGTYRHGKVARVADTADSVSL